MELKRKYLCIFCGRRVDTNRSIYNNGHVGMCPDCLSKLNFTPRPPLFPSEGVDYVISPVFYEGKIQRLLVDLKFNDCRANAEVLGHLLCDLLSDMTHIADFDFIVPVPLSKKRFTERGFNQSELIAKPLAEFFGVPFRDDLLFKIRDTKRQSRVDVAERYANVRGAYRAEADVKNKRIILVDDIVTTGNTLKACAEALKEAGASNIVGLTVAAREKPNNISNSMY